MIKFTSMVSESIEQKLPGMIDFTFLKKNASVDEIKDSCRTATEAKFRAICVQPEYISTATAFVENNSLKIVSVVSFPDGDKKTLEKTRDVSECITSGADELDVVFNYKMIKKLTGSDDPKYNETIELLSGEVSKITRDCHRNGVVVKYIIETGALTYDQISIICDIILKSGADYVMTSTGTLKNEEALDKKLEKVIFMRKLLPDSIGIKVSGGIYSFDDASKFINYVDRIGTSKII